MPFDGTDSKTKPKRVKAPEQVPDLSKPSYAALVYLLRHPRLWQKKLLWDFSNVLLDEEGNSLFYSYRAKNKESLKCGTQGCAVGVALIQWSKAAIQLPAAATDYAGWVQKFLGSELTRNEIDDIFFDSGMVYGNRPTDNVKPRHVATAIEKALARKAKETTPATAD